MAVFPPPLRKGGTIGVVSPSRWPKPEWLDNGQAFFERRGYRVVIHPQNMAQDGQLAGSARMRAQAINNMFADPAIDAIICARGGTGAIQLLDKLDYAMIGQNPKPFIGFSDITLLLNAISACSGFVTFHGPMFWNFANEYDTCTETDFFTVLGGGQGKANLVFEGVETMRSGKARGRLVGGNISLLEKLIGTPYDWSGQNAILLIEDTDEAIYKLDNVLRHFRLAGKFDGLRAVLVGEMCNITDGETSAGAVGDHPFGRSLKEILLDTLPSDIPLCLDFPAGHGKYLTTLPVGAEVGLSLKDSVARLEF